MQRLSAQHITWSFAADVQAAYTVQPGEIFQVETRDALDGLVHPGMTEKPKVERANPATGPVAVPGLLPSQTLAVEIMAIDLADWGYLTFGGHPRFFDQRAGLIDFAAGVHLVPAPMIGTIGLMPVQGSFSSMIPGDFGGNMDVRDVAPGATLYLQAQLAGGLLALGDVHATQGDGESSGQGIETAATVTLRLRVIPKGLSPRPYLVRNGELMIIVSADTLDLAAKQAVEALATTVAQHSPLSYEEARMLIGQAGHVRVGQIVNPQKTVRAAIPLLAVPWHLPLAL